MGYQVVLASAVVEVHEGREKNLLSLGVQMGEVEGAAAEVLEAPTGLPEADQEDLRDDYNGKDETVVGQDDYRDGKADDCGCTRVAGR